MKLLEKNKIGFVLLTFIIFFIGLYGKNWLDHFITLDFPDKYWRYAYFTCCWLIGVPVLFLSIKYGYKKVLPELGLRVGFITGIIWGFIITLPMLIGYALVSDKFNFNVADLIAYSVLAAIAEEILFRGFLFGQLSRYANWKLWMGALAEASIFGFVHLYQAHNWMNAVGIFAITFAGGLLFGWLYIKWNYNLWLPIVLHLLMNAYWGIFHMGENALGGSLGNIFRAAAVVVAIIVTIKFSKKDFVSKFLAK
jgi:uncharacterized protein